MKTCIPLFTAALCIINPWLDNVVYAGHQVPAQNTGSIPGEKQQEVQPGTGTIEVLKIGDTLSVKLVNAPLSRVSELLSEQTGIRVRISSNAGEYYLSYNFSGLLIEKALHRLLQGINYVLIYDGDGNEENITNLFILPPGEKHQVTEKDRPHLKDIDPKALINALSPGSFPPGVREVMMNNAKGVNQKLKKDISTRRTEALNKLLEYLESSGMPGSKTTMKLRDHIRNNKALKLNENGSSR